MLWQELCKRQVPPFALRKDASGDALPSRSTPCGASPAHIASLVRAPLRCAKGAY